MSSQLEQIAALEKRHRRIRLIKALQEEVKACRTLGITAPSIEGELARLQAEITNEQKAIREMMAACPTCGKPF